MENYEKVFKESCLVQISTPKWGGTLQLPASVMEKVGDSRFLKGKKHLVDPDYLLKISSASSKARTKISKYVVPFPIQSCLMIHRDNIAKVDELLLEVQNEFWQCVDDFVEVYDQAKNEAKEILGDNFDATNYPDNIRDKFNFKYRFIMIGTPDQNSVLTPEFYEREKAKFVDMMDEAKRDATVALRQEFAEFVSHLIEKLQTKTDGKPMQFKNATVTNFQEFLDMFKTRNLFEDKELEKLVEKAHNLIGNVDPNALRDTAQSNLKQHIKDEFSKINEEISEFLQVAPRRKIVLPK
jgi:hypothetical protein